MTQFRAPYRKASSLLLSAWGAAGLQSPSPSRLLPENWAYKRTLRSLRVMRERTRRYSFPKVRGAFSFRCVAMSKKSSKNFSREFRLPVSERSSRLRPCFSRYLGRGASCRYPPLQTHIRVSSKNGDYG